MTVRVKRQVRVGGLAHIAGNLWEVLRALTGHFPHSSRRFIQENVSKGLAGARQMKQVERGEIPKTLNAYTKCTRRDTFEWNMYLI